MVVFHVEERNVPRILITERLAQAGLDLLRRELPEALIDQRIGLAPAQLRTVLGGYTVLIVDSDTRVTDDLLRVSPHLQLIGRAGSDVANIDLEAAGRRGVLVVYAQGGDVPALAEHSIAMLLALARHIAPANNSLKAGRRERSHFVGMELANKTLGILGPGKVGREVARLAQAFSMRMLGKTEVLQQADFVMLHAAHLSDSSKAAMLISVRELRLLRPSAYLLNCADGSLIDEAALLAALEQGRLAGAALDVISQEPIGDDRVLQRLLAHERMLATPHLGALTREAHARVATELARNVVSTLRGDTLIGAILSSFPPMAPP